MSHVPAVLCVQLVSCQRLGRQHISCPVTGMGVLVQEGHRPIQAWVFVLASSPTPQLHLAPCRHLVFCSFLCSDRQYRQGSWLSPSFHRVLLTHTWSFFFQLCLQSGELNSCVTTFWIILLRTVQIAQIGRFALLFYSPT